MLLKEILLDANLLVPNSINDAIKVRWLNNIQAQLYRDFGFPDTSKAFTTEIGKNLYPLPSDCSRERITSVIVDGRDYDYRTIDQDITENCWTISGEKLFIYPTPSQSVPAYINYRPRPKDMRLDMQDVKPDFPEDFHEVLVYGVAVRIAQSQQESNRAAELQATFNELQNIAKRELRPSRNKSVRVNHAWR